MKEFTIIRSLLDNRKRKLFIDRSCIKFENSDLKSNLFTTFHKEEIAGLRYGFEMINGLEFYIGREYKIFILNKNGKELKINFKLFYGRKLQEKHQLYSDIVDEIWENFCEDLINNYFEKFQNKVEFSICEVTIQEYGISFKNTIIKYEDLEVRSFKHYYMIQSKADPYQNKMLYYLKDSNAVLLFSLLDRILNAK